MTTQAPESQPTAAQSKPPVSISSQCHLDPACYVKGSHLLTIERDAVLHPRCRLYTDQGSIAISQGCMLNERCILGLDKDLNPAIPHDLTDTEFNIKIGARTTLGSSVKIQPPSTIGEAVVLEAGVVVSPGCVVGAHSKVCAGVVLPVGTKVPERTVVYGLRGEMRRRRRIDLEESRLEGLEKERTGVEVALKLNGVKPSTAVSSRKRESVLVRNDSQKG